MPGTLGGVYPGCGSWVCRGGVLPTQRAIGIARAQPMARRANTGSQEARYRVPGGQIQGPRSQIPGVRFQESDSRIQESDSRSQIPGSRSQYPGSKSQYPGSKSQYPGSQTQYISVYLSISQLSTVNRLSTTVFCSWTFVRPASGTMPWGYTFLGTHNSPYFHDLYIIP